MSEDIKITATSDFDSWFHESPTQLLQFVRRDGKLTLQQKWLVRTDREDKYEWRDVPLNEENSNG